MKKPLLLVFFLSLSALLFSQNIQPSSNAFFYENKGQIIDQDGNEYPDIKYLFTSNGLNVQIKNQGFSYDVYEVEKTLKKMSNEVKQDPFNDGIKEKKYNYKYEYHRVDIDFVGANKNPVIIAEGKSADYENYYNRPNRPEGIEKVYRYQKITYKNLYANIDLVFFKPDDTLKPVEYNFIVNPGGKISNIRLKFKGAKTKLKNGKLSMNLRFGEMQENIPHSWEENGNSRNTIGVEFTDLGNGIFGFKSEKNISDKVMVIDPVPTRIWSTDNYNGTHISWGYLKVLTDKNNKIYTLDQRLAKFDVTTGTHIQGATGSQDYGYVASFDENGVKRWGLYLGNHHHSQDNSNRIRDFELDSENNLIIVGGARDDASGNNTITTPGSYQEHSMTSSTMYRQNDGFIMKFNNAGQKLWGTYYGGTQYEIFNSIEIDSQDNLILSGLSGTPNLILNTIQNVINGKNEGQFVAKFTSNGQYVNAYLFPVSYNWECYTAIDKNDNIYLSTSSGKSFAGNVGGNTNTHQTAIIGAENVFLAKIDRNFNYQWGTYFGGRNRDGIFYNNDYGNTKVEEIKCDEDGNIIIAGRTDALEKIATPGTHKQNNSNDYNDMYIAKFAPDGKQIWGTYYGDANPQTTGDDNLFCLDIDEHNNIFVGGWTASKNNITTPDGYIPNFDFYNQGFFSKFNPTGNLVWGSYLKRPVLAIHSKNNFVYTFTNFEVMKFYDCKNAINYSSNSPVCVNSPINLKASGGTTYSWTGPNGFSSTQQNPTIPNATILNSGIYSCNISGTGGCDGTFTIEVKVEDKTAPVPTVANLPLITGNCKTIIKVIPTATDVCMGNIVATTANPLQYSLPGNYVITWKYDDGNGNISTQNQNVTITSEPLPIANAAQNFCKIISPKISDLQITGTSIKWYNAAGNPLSSNTVLTDGTKYYASQTLNGCESAKTEVKVTLNDPMAPTGSTQQDFCSAQNPTISHLTVTGQNIIWYDSAGAMLTSSTPLSDSKTYYATQTVGGCESTQKLAVKVSVANGGIPANDYATAFCNDTTANTKTVDLNNYITNLIANTAGLIFEFYDSANQLIANPANQKLNIGLNAFHVKISNALGCFVYVKLNLTLHPKPALNLPASAEFCAGQSVDLDAGSGFSSYEWNKDGSGAPVSTNQILNVTTAGTYNLKVKNSFGCENSASVTVTQSSLGTITGVQIVNNTATVIMSNSGSFLYSLDNAVWQSSNTFTNLSNGNHTVYVKTSGDCVIGQMNFTIFNVPNSFTPNADGINDTWKIDGMENYPNSDIKVYDRNGKLVLSKITAGTFEWDGKFDSRALPTGSYWYIIKVSDGRILNGWLLIKNRS